MATATQTKKQTKTEAQNAVEFFANAVLADNDRENLICLLAVERALRMDEETECQADEPYKLTINNVMPHDGATMPGDILSVFGFLTEQQRSSTMFYREFRAAFFAAFRLEE